MLVTNSFVPLVHSCASLFFSCFLNCNVHVRHANNTKSNIIHDILLFVNSFQSFSFSHVCRQGNALADALAKKARLSCPFMVWMESIPPDLYNCYLSDFLLFN